MPRDKKLYKYEMPLDGKLITRDDPAKIGPNFQSLVNMRYYGNTIRGIGGMSKVNSNALATYTKVRAAHHFKKDQPSESHVLAEAWNTGLSAARIYDNTTAIGSDGDFSATSLYTPTSTTPGGVFSDAPDGDVAYCNGAESLIWGGAEREMAGFINYDPSGDFLYDFTEQLRNTKTDSENLASITTTSAGVDGNTKGLYHFDNAVTDSSGNSNTLTNANVTFSTSGAVFGTHRAVFTTDAKLTRANDADFNLSGGTFTIDMHVELDDLDEDYSIYYDYTTNNDDSFNVMVDSDGAVLVRIMAAGAKAFAGAVDFTTADDVISAGTTYHIEVGHSGNDWYIFVDGVLKAYLSDAAEPADYDSGISIGYDLTTYLEGKIDELRISNAARHTSDFEVPTEAYGTSTTSAYMYIGSVRPLDGFKLYVNTANTSESDMTAYYWSGSGWTAVSSLSDGTSASSKSLAQTGSVTFTSTDGSASLKYIEGVYVYWYKVVVDAVSSGTELYYVTVSAPMQTIKDIWDGAPRQIDSFQIYKGSYSDATLNVRESEYDSLNTGTLVEIEGLTATTQWIICGFVEKMSGVTFNFVSGNENTTASTVCSVDYWDGSDWDSVGTIDDGTVTNNISFGKNGTITWNPPTSEYRQTINPVSNVRIRDISASYLRKGKKLKYLKRFKQAAQNDASLYYYRFKFSKNLDATEVQIYHINGIPTQTKIGDYNIPLLASNRLFLLADETDKKHAAICSSDDTSSVFNGEDSYFFEFGGDARLTGGAWINSYIGNNVYNIIFFFKSNETWALFGDSPDDWVQSKRRLSATVGCIAPHTIRVVDIPTEQGGARTVVVWQGADGIYMSDGRSPVKISGDIDDIFDKRIGAGSVISTSAGDNSVSFWDEYHKCYHWIYTVVDGSSHASEFVFDFQKPGWFQVDRGSGNYLQYGIRVEAVNGTKYDYGFLDTGFMYQLEDGNDMDGDAIVQYFRTGDLVLLEGSITTECKVEYVCLVATSKTNTDQDIRFRYYMDGSSSRNQWTKSPLKTGYNLTFPVEHNDQKGAGIFHSFEVYIATDDEVIGLEPQYMYVLYSTHRDHTGDWR